VIGTALIDIDNVIAHGSRTVDLSKYDGRCNANISYFKCKYLEHTSRGFKYTLAHYLGLSVSFVYTIKIFSRAHKLFFNIIIFLIFHCINQRHRGTSNGTISIHRRHFFAKDRIRALQT